MNSNSIFKKENLFLIFLFLFSLLFNQYYGSRGVFPIDSFLIFDAGYNILSGNHPFKDYWLITGPFLDYVQSFFFFIFGVNWFSYVLHASLLNMVLAIYTYYFFKKLGLNNVYSFIYSMGVAILAYPTAGTPFIDHHAVILSVMALYSLSLSILLKKNLFWFLVPLLLIFSFFSKQIPSPYIASLFTIVTVIYFYFTKNIYKKNLLYLLYSCLFSFLLISFVFYINQIPTKNFFIQYIFYPISLGADRILELNIDFKNLISQFKFIYLAILPVVFSVIFLLRIKKKNLSQKNDLTIAILFIGSTLIFIYSQLLTKNQVFIFFLIPILLGISQIYIKKCFKINYFIYILLIIFAFTTTKYHIRFNHNKKFIELSNADFSLSVEAKKLDNKLSGLKWISPYYINEPEKEIDLLIESKKIISSSKERKIIITDYLFFSSLTENKFASPNKWYDGLSTPKKENKYYLEYKNFLLSKLKENKIKYVYLLRKNEDIFFKEFIDEKNCIIASDLNEILEKLDLKQCNF